MRAKHETHADRPAHPSRWGFTLVELLLVMFILSVLVGLVVGVSRYVIEEGRKKETIVKQKNLVAAIEGYRKVVGKIPNIVYTPDDTTIPSDPGYRYTTSTQTIKTDDPSVQMACLIKELTTGNPLDNVTVDVNSPIYKATRPFLGSSGTSLTTDAYGNSMLYLKDRGVGGTPVIVSAGADGMFGYEREYKDEPNDRIKYEKDNIRSDRN